MVTIVIPHAGPVELLKGCIETVKRNTSTPYEIIVIDDKPDGETQAYLTSLSKEDVEVVVNPKLMGVEQALNNGFQRARGNYICLLTTSYQLSPGSIDALKDCLGSHPEFGWVALPLEERTAFVAGCSMMTKVAFQRVGLWDESYSVGYGFSDDDYMRRMWKAGYKPHIVDGPRTRHLRKTATALLRGDKEAEERFARAQAVFFRNYGEWGTDWDKFPIYKGE